MSNGLGSLPHLSPRPHSSQSWALRLYHLYPQGLGHPGIWELAFIDVIEYSVYAKDSTWIFLLHTHRHRYDLHFTSEKAEA